MNSPSLGDSANTLDAPRVDNTTAQNEGKRYTAKYPAHAKCLLLFSPPTGVLQLGLLAPRADRLLLPLLLHV